MTKVKTRLSVKVEQDHDTESPREWDNLGTMACEHRRYNLGDEKISDSELFDNDLHPTPEAKKTYVFLPLYLYDHSGISISTQSFHGRAQHAEWDSGQVGYIYVSKEKVIKEFDEKRWSKELEKDILGRLDGEIETYDTFLRGEVFGYAITEHKVATVDNEEFEHDEVVDSCWGFFGSNHDENGLKDSVRAYDKALAETIN